MFHKFQHLIDFCPNVHHLNVILYYSILHNIQIESLELMFHKFQNFIEFCPTVHHSIEMSLNITKYIFIFILSSFHCWSLDWSDRSQVGFTFQFYFHYPRICVSYDRERSLGFTTGSLDTRFRCWLCHDHGTHVHRWNCNSQNTRCAWFPNEFIHCV